MARHAPSPFRHVGIQLRTGASVTARRAALQEVGEIHFPLSFTPISAVKQPEKRDRGTHHEIQRPSKQTVIHSL